MLRKKQRYGTLWSKKIQVLMSTELLLLWRKGMHLMKKISQQGMQESIYSYMEFGVTHSRPLLENLVVGLRLKTLFGLLNFNTKTFEFGLNGQNKDNASAHLRCSHSNVWSIDVTLNPDGFFNVVSFGSGFRFEFINPGLIWHESCMNIAKYDF